MKNRTITLLPQKRANLLPCLLFLSSVLISVFTTYYATGHYIDSDASSELVLAKHLAETGQILSRDWIYSTELRVLNTQLVYAPLFLIFSDWHMVRFFGAIILQAIMILSYAFLIHQTGLHKRVFYISAALLLLPVNVCYGRIVLYHSYYLPHIALSYFILGLILGFAKHPQWNHWKSWLRLFLLLLFSFAGGLGGIRQLMITHAPVLIAIVITSFVEDAQKTNDNTASIFSRNKLCLILPAVLAAASSFLGLKVNTSILGSMFVFEKNSANLLYFLDPSNIDDLLYGYFHQFGFRNGVKLISLSGILSVGAVFAGAYSIFVAVQSIKKHKAGQDIRKVILKTFFIYYVSIMLFIFLITGGAQPYHFILYFVLCTSWSVPMLVSDMEDVPKTVSLFNVRRIFSWVSVLILLLNGLANVTFFNGSKLFNQPYEGLIAMDMDQKESMTDMVNFLSENGYYLGYAPFWDCNIITEMTDGEIRMMSIMPDDQTGNIALLDWLTIISQRTEPNEKPFIILRHATQPAFENTDIYGYCSLVYKDDIYCVYDVLDYDRFVAHLFSQL